MGRTVDRTQPPRDVPGSAVTISMPHLIDVLGDRLTAEIQVGMRDGRLLVDDQTVGMFDAQAVTCPGDTLVLCSESGLWKLDVKVVP